MTNEEVRTRLLAQYTRNAGSISCRVNVLVCGPEQIPWDQTLKGIERPKDANQTIRGLSKTRRKSWKTYFYINLCLIFLSCSIFLGFLQENILCIVSCSNFEKIQVIKAKVGFECRSNWICNAFVCNTPCKLALQPAAGKRTGLSFRYCLSFQRSTNHYICCIRGAAGHLGGDLPAWLDFLQQSSMCQAWNRF